MVKYSVYVIQNDNNQMYKGMTTNVQKRVIQHNKVSGKWTSRRGPWRLIFAKDFENKSDALKYEKYLKSGPGRSFLKNFVS